MATSPEPNPLEGASDEASFLESDTSRRRPRGLEETGADGPFESETFETSFAEAPAANPDVNPEAAPFPTPIPPIRPICPSRTRSKRRRRRWRRARRRRFCAPRRTRSARRFARPPRRRSRRTRSVYGKRRTRRLSTLSRSPSRSRTRPSRPARRAAEAIDESFEEAAVSAYGANDGNATTAFPRSSAFPETETDFVEEPTSASLDGGVRVRRHRNRRRCARRV